MKSNIYTKVKKIKTLKKKFFQEKSEPKIVFDTRVVKKVSLEMVASYTKNHPSFLCKIYVFLLNKVYITTIII